MHRTVSAIGLSILIVGAIPFAFLTLVWSVFVVTSILTPAAWSSKLLLSISKVVGLMALFWYGASQVGARLSVPFSRAARAHSNIRLLLGTVALVFASVVLWYISRYDSKLSGLASAFLAPIGAVPFCLVLNLTARR
jgi:hypothetical protein